MELKVFFRSKYPSEECAQLKLVPAGIQVIANPRPRIDQSGTECRPWNWMTFAA